MKGLNAFLKSIKEWVIIIAVALFINFVLRTFLVANIIIPSESMLPTIEKGDRMFASKIVNENELNYSDIIIFHPPIPGEENTQYIKRVIGTEGDTVEIKDNKLYINNEPIKEEYLHEDKMADFGPITVPENKLIVMGDNRNNSYDSRFWNEFLDEKEVIGKAGFRFFPFDRMGFLK